MKKKRVMKKKSLTPVQETVLRNLVVMKRSKFPSEILEILAKKLLVFGNVRVGWKVTPEGRDWIVEEDLKIKHKSSKRKWAQYG